MSRLTAYVLKYNGIANRLIAMTSLIGREPISSRDQVTAASEMAPWGHASLSTVFEEAYPLFKEDLDAMTTICRKDSLGSLLKDQ